MNKLLAALIAGAFATVVAAQTQPPKPTTKERQADTAAATAAGSGSSASAEKTAAQQKRDTAISKEVSKMSPRRAGRLVARDQQADDQPEQPVGQRAGTAAMQKETTAISKTVPKDRPSLNTKSAEKALEKASTQ